MSRGKWFPTGVKSSTTSGEGTQGSEIWLRLDALGMEVGIVTQKTAIYVRRSDFPKLVQKLLEFQRILEGECRE